MKVRVENTGEDGSEFLRWRWRLQLTGPRDGMVLWSLGEGTANGRGGGDGIGTVRES